VAENAWHGHADALAEWCMCREVSSVDRFGGYHRLEDIDTPWYRRDSSLGGIRQSTRTR
jgi:hypothetical protein